MMDKFGDQADGLKEPGLQAVSAQDVELEAALKDFRASIHAWSDAAYNRPRTLAQEVTHRSWRLAVGWALGCVLVAGSVSGGLFARQHRREQARIAAARHEADRQKELRDQLAREEDEEDLLAKVDSDVSRQVPSAMEPLAQMMSEDDETK
jgi:hypothetical protein